MNQRRAKEYKHYLETNVTPKTKPSDRLSPSSVRSYLKAMESVTDGLVQDGYIFRGQTIYDIDEPILVSEIYQSIMNHKSCLSDSNFRSNRTISSAIKHYLDMLLNRTTVDEMIEMRQTRGDEILSDAYDELIEKLGHVIHQVGTASGERKLTLVRKRLTIVKSIAFKRANGKCDHCGKPTFLTESGNLYFECHHVDPLADGGDDDIYNVVSLCPNCHRLVHYGSRPLRKDANKQLLNRIEIYLADSSIQNSNLCEIDKFQSLKEKATSQFYLL